MIVKLDYSETDIIVIATQEYRYHPKSTLIDFYKLFFQSYYGQGHFISNDITAKRNLESELLRMNSSYHPYIQDISNRRGIFRISLDAIKRKLITIDDFLIMFLHKKQYSINWNEWSDNWDLIMSLLLRLYPGLNIKSDITHCAEVIRNKAMTSHSEDFGLTYQPHYRVMQLSEYELLKFNDLKEYL